MKTITVDYYVQKRKTFSFSDMPKTAKDFLKAWFTDDDDRTDSQWDILDKYELDDIISLLEGSPVVDTEIYDYE